MRAGWAVLAMLPAFVSACAQPTPKPALARSPTLVAIRPGLMCRSSDALARLTLHDGSSRLLGKHPRAGDYATKQQGLCLDFGPGERATLVQARRNTSIVMPLRQSGSYVVPSIDFRREGEPQQAAPAEPAAETPPAKSRRPPAPPRIGETTRTFANAVAQACPEQGWTAPQLATSRSGPVAHVFTTMSRGERRVAHDEVAANCRGSAGADCANETKFGVMIRAGHLPDMVQAACSRQAP